VIIALIKANYLMKKVSKEVLLKYRKASNPLKIAVIRIINTLVTYCFQMRKVDMMATLVLVNTTLILRHGFTDETGSTLSAFGTILAWSGDFSKGRAIGEIAVEIVRETKVDIPRTFTNYYGGLDHLKKPLHQSLEPLLHAYRTGFEVGDTVYGFYCCHFYLSIFFYVGLPLNNLLKDMTAFSQEMGSYNVCSALHYLKIYHQSVINLTSNVSNPTILDGEAMTESTLLCCGMQRCIEALWFGKLIMAVYFNDYEVLLDNLNKLAFGRPQELDGCMYYVNMMLWTEGLGAIIVARKTGRQKYRKLAFKRVRKMEAWVKGGNVNCSHALMHLHAEIAVLKRKPESQIKALFDSAISASRRAGFSNFVAVINERFAYYYLGVSDVQRASTYMSTAFEMYQNWGALRKCMALLQEHPNLLPSSIKSSNFHSMLSTSSMGTSCKGRKRHSGSVSKLHSGEHFDWFSESASLNLDP
jgi:histidine kinase